MVSRNHNTLSFSPCYQLNFSTLAKCVDFFASIFSQIDHLTCSCGLHRRKRSLERRRGIQISVSKCGAPNYKATLKQKSITWASTCSFRSFQNVLLMVIVMTSSCYVLHHKHTSNCQNIAFSQNRLAFGYHFSFYL